MRRGFKRGDILYWLLVGSVAVLLIALWGMVFDDYEVFSLDVGSGQTKSERVILGFVVSRSVQDTPFSVLIAKVGLTEPSEWHAISSKGRSLTYLRSGLTDHGYYGKALYLMTLWAKVCDLSEIAPDEVRRRTSLFITLLRGADVDGMQAMIDREVSHVEQELGGKGSYLVVPPVVRPEKSVGGQTGPDDETK